MGYSFKSARNTAILELSPLGNELGLVGYWNFEEGSGNTIFDQTSNGNNGIINGAMIQMFQLNLVI